MDMRMTNIKITQMPIAEIQPYENNAKKHDQRQIDNVAESIRKYGFVQPIVIDNDNVIVIGHCRVLAAQKLGMQTVPCIAVENLTPEQVHALRIVDNKSNESPWDFELLAAELEELDFDGFDFDWGLDEEKTEAIDLDEDNQAVVEGKKQCHCPKCGFVFEI